MTFGRIQQIREWIAGNGSPRDRVPLSAAECRDLLDLAESTLRQQRTKTNDDPQTLRCDAPHAR
jgi:hypothetical protein